ncbi:MAG TPA: GNAT family N-acetyltransferase [Steroidobacteraceae bacterium]|nr:GNAT family N-acetyltransferase [Steroidobacteraceae bacterium]
MSGQPQIEIRPATPEDAAQILAFIRELAEYEQLAHAVVATEADLHSTLFGPQPYAHALIACEAGVPLGFAVYFYNYSTFAGRPGLYLEDLYVRQAARGRGIGRRLLAHLAQIALERGCARMEWAVLDWNEPAIRFYVSLGAAPNEEWTTYRLSRAGIAALARSP